MDAPNWMMTEAETAERKALLAVPHHETTAEQRQRLSGLEKKHSDECAILNAIH